MKDNNFVKTINKFNFIDYQKPLVPIKNDMRTSYFFGHRNYLLNEHIKPSAASNIDTCTVLANTTMRYDYRTEHRRQYRMKMPVEQVPKAKLPMSARKPQFVQTQQEKTFRQPPKPIVSTATNDRTYPTPTADVFCERFIPTASIYRSPPASKDIVYCQQPGRSKYMDPYATTTMLDYPPRTVDQQNGIGSKDYITVYDWLEFPKGKGFGLHFYPVKKKGFKEPIGDRIRFPLFVKDRLIPNTKELVPHNGMRSEQRTEYSVPVQMEYEPDVYEIAPLAVPPTGLKTGNTEYTMYGSGDRIDKYIQQYK